MGPGAGQDELDKMNCAEVEQVWNRAAVPGWGLLYSQKLATLQPFQHLLQVGDVGIMF